MRLRARIARGLLAGAAGSTALAGSVAVGPALAAPVHAVAAAPAHVGLAAPAQTGQAARAAAAPRPATVTARSRPKARAASVQLARGAAHPARGGGVLLRWRTATESANVGFTVLRARRATPKRTAALNPRLVAGAVLRVSVTTRVRSPRDYRWLDPTGRRGDRYFVRAVDVRGKLQTGGPYVAGGRTVARASSSPLLKATAATPAHPPTQGASGPAEPTAPPNPVIAPGTPPEVVQATLAARPTVRVGVDGDGWARVELADLANRGADVSVPVNLHLFTGGTEVAAVVRDGGLEFFGRAIDTLDTGTRTYVVDAETGPGLRMRTAPSAADAPDGPQDFPDTATRADRRLYFTNLLNGEQTNFFGDAITTGGSDQTVAVPGLSGGTPRVTVVLQGVTTKAHEVSVAVNGDSVGTISFDGQQAGQDTFAAPSVHAGTNTVRLIAGSGGDVSVVASTSVRYQRELTAAGEALGFTAPGGRRVRVGGFTAGGVRVADVTDPDRPVLVPDSERAGSVAATAPGDGTRRLLAFGPAAVVPVASVATGTASGWRSADHDGALTIVTTPAMADALAPLVAARRAEGLSVAVVALQDVYDEFAQGQTDHHAIRALIDTARATWRTPPRYVLLGGDGSSDPRGFQGRGTAGDVIPIQPYDTTRSEVSSDSELTGTLATGRLPARTPDAMAALVAKTLAYPGGSVGATLVSDVSDTFDFRGASDALAPLLPSDWPVTQLDRGSQADAHARLLGALRAGPRLVNYVGHGSVDLWRGDLLTDADAGALTGAPGLYVLMTCLNGSFTDATLPALAEALLGAPGGAAAVFSSTATTDPGAQVPANRELLRTLYGGDAGRLGDAVVASLGATPDGDVRATWTLLGDPTLPAGA